MKKAVVAIFLILLGGFFLDSNALAEDYSKDNPLDKAYKKIEIGRMGFGNVLFILLDYQKSDEHLFGPYISWVKDDTIKISPTVYFNVELPKDMSWLWILSNFQGGNLIVSKLKVTFVKKDNGDIVANKMEYEYFFQDEKVELAKPD